MWHNIVVENTTLPANPDGSRTSLAGSAQLRLVISSAIVLLCIMAKQPDLAVLTEAITPRVRDCPIVILAFLAPANECYSMVNDGVLAARIVDARK